MGEARVLIETVSPPLLLPDVPPPLKVSQFSLFRKSTPTMIDISSCLPIEGWMDESELTWLAKTAQSRLRIVEVGSWCGRSTRALALHAKGKVWAVDAWIGMDSIESGRENPDLFAEAEKAWEMFNSNTKEFDNVTVIKQDSLDALEYLPKTVDFIFIDGDHHYERVKSEIEAYSKLLMPGGILSGHDIHMEGVNQAVRESIHHLMYPAGQIWMTVKG